MFGNDLPEGCIVCLANPVNPLGAAFGRADVEALLARVEDARGWLIVDEAFVDYCPECSVRDLVPEHTRLLVAGSMTKVLGVPGVRLGTLCARPEVLGRLSECQLAWELNCFAAAIARALPGGAGAIRAEAEGQDEAAVVAEKAGEVERGLAVDRVGRGAGLKLCDQGGTLDAGSQRRERPTK